MVPAQWQYYERSKNNVPLHKVYAVVNEGEGEVRAKKFPTLECYESGEVRDGMKKSELVTQNHAAKW